MPQIDLTFFTIVLFILYISFIILIKLINVYILFPSIISLKTIIKFKQLLLDNQYYLINNNNQRANEINFYGYNKFFSSIPNSSSFGSYNFNQLFLFFINL